MDILTSLYRANYSAVTWARGTAQRALRTFCQTLAGFVTVGLTLDGIPWGVALSTSTVSAIYSILTSVWDPRSADTAVAVTEAWHAVRVADGPHE